MISRALLSNGLPSRVVEHFTHAFVTLNCTEPAIVALVDTLAAFSAARHLTDPNAIQRIFSLLVAANHSITCLSGPASPLPTNPIQPLPSTTEWLLLAARERAAASLPSALEQAVDTLIAQLDTLATTTVNSTKASPVVDYGLGSLFAAIAQETNESSTFAAGQALGKLARLTLEVIVSTRPSAPFVAPELLRFVTTSDQESECRLRLAVAMACKPVPDKLPLLSFLGQPMVRTRIIEACATWSEASTAAFERSNVNVLQTFLQATNDVIAAKLNSLRLFGFAKPPSLAMELDRSITLAVDALLADPELRESWEVQRWGGPFPRTCVARVFPVGLCLLALATASVDVSSAIASLLSLRCADGYRYFEGFDGIPPDADDLGLALQLVARSPHRDDYIDALAWPVEVLMRNTSVEGEVPVWFERDLREPLNQDAPQWRGSRCLAVAANTLVGLLEARVPLTAGYIDRAIAWINHTWRADGTRSVFFYGLSYARFVLVRLADVAEGRIEDHAIYEELRAIATGIEDEIVGSVSDDGGFGGIIDTACHCAALACGRRAMFDPWPTVAFLASRQEHDGLWPAEPLYPTPGKDYAPGAHGARSITTALCLYALARTRERLRREALA